jgi:hypothetical protein
MANHLYHFTVEGKGYFPLDMLRYDSCYPAKSEDVTRILDHGSPNYLQEKARIVLAHLSTVKYWEPTVARWKSFGWDVVEVLTPYRV